MVDSLVLTYVVDSFDLHSCGCQLAWLLTCVVGDSCGGLVACGLAWCAWVAMVTVFSDLESFHLVCRECVAPIYAHCGLLKTLL